MFSELLKELRTKKGVTQIQLADAIGVSNGNVGDWERGRSKPGYDAIASLARYFNVTTDYLLEIDRSVNTRIKGAPELDKYLSKQIALDSALLMINETNNHGNSLYCDGIPLSESERDLIAMYRLLEAADKKTVFDITKLKYEQMTGEKVSIYSTYSDTQADQNIVQKSNNNSSEGIA